MRNNSITLLLVLLLTLSFSTRLFASDFVFEVPVKLDKIPRGIPQAKIQCDVFGYRDNQVPVASGYAIRPVGSHRGELVETIPVNVNFFSDKRHINPHSYHCKLMLLIPWGNPAWQNPSQDAPEESIRPLKNSNAVVLVEGLIPSQ